MLDKYDYSIYISNYQDLLTEIKNILFSFSYKYIANKYNKNNITLLVSTTNKELDEINFMINSLMNLSENNNIQIFKKI